MAGTGTGTGTGDSDAGTRNRAAVLMAHYDVVPAGDGDAWTHPPFSGHNDGTHLWGRGTLDDKGQLVAILEAAEALLAAGFAPVDESTSPSATTRKLPVTAPQPPPDSSPARGVRPWLVLDEGGAVAGDAFPGVSRPAAVVGVAEKGSWTWNC